MSKNDLFYFCTININKSIYCMFHKYETNIASKLIINIDSVKLKYYYYT